MREETTYQRMGMIIKPERHNIVINPITDGKEYHVYCSFGDFNQTCRTERAARGYAYLHAVESACNPDHLKDLQRKILQDTSI